MTEQQRDLVVLGGGSAGYAAALRAAQLGLSVAIVEADEVGGTCLHRGCIPTKAQLQAAHVAEQVRQASRYGITATLTGVDQAGVRGFADGIVAGLHRGLQGLLRQRQVTLVKGWGRLVRDGSGVGVQVGDELWRGRSVLVATGARPETLGLPVDGERILTSEDALRLDNLPRNAVVLGGGVIGVEFASLWHSLGVEVTVVEALECLLPAEEQAVSAAVKRAFTKRGITVRCSSRLEDARVDGEQVRLTLSDGTKLSADALLVAVGRAPHTAGLGLEAAGVRLEGGHVVVDEHLSTSLSGVFAAGDVVPGPQLAHRGFAHGIAVTERIAHLRGLLDQPTPVTADHLFPRVTYCSPEVASVGLGREAAAALGSVRVVEYDLRGNGRSQVLGSTGFVQVVALDDGPVVGVHMVGDGVSELIGEAQLAVGWEATAADFAGLLHAHPTQGEALGEAFMALAGAPLHVHG